MFIYANYYGSVNKVIVLLVRLSYYMEPPLHYTHNYFSLDLVVYISHN